jgi:hypothetical protein
VPLQVQDVALEVKKMKTEILKEKRTLRIRSLLVDVLKLFLLKSRQKKVFILAFLAGLPLSILVWLLMLVALPVTLFLGLGGLFVFILSFTSMTPFTPDKSYLKYFALLTPLMVGITFFACRSQYKLYFRTLKTSFQSREFYIEILLPIIGVILGLLGLVWLFVLPTV